jgi:hypothetical protein
MSVTNHPFCGNIALLGRSESNNVRMMALVAVIPIADGCSVRGVSKLMPEIKVLHGIKSELLGTAESPGGVIRFYSRR